MSMTSLGAQNTTEASILVSWQTKLDHSQKTYWHETQTRPARCLCLVPPIRLERFHLNCELREWWVSDSWYRQEGRLNFSQLIACSIANKNKVLSEVHKVKASPPVLAPYRSPAHTKDKARMEPCQYYCSLVSVRATDGWLETSNLITVLVFCMNRL